MNTEPQVSVPTTRIPRHPNFWLKELPFSLVLLLTLLGVAWTSFSRELIVGYWEVLAPVIALVCVGAGWSGAIDRAARTRLIVTQALHWLSFIVVMNVMLLPSVQRNFTTGATGVAVFTLLALGTFTAGVQVMSWQIGVLGLVMAFCIPLIAWIETSALAFFLLALLVIAVIAFVWWRWRAHRGA